MENPVDFPTRISIFPLHNDSHSNFQIFSIFFWFKLKLEVDWPAVCSLNVGDERKQEKKSLFHFSTAQKKVKFFPFIMNEISVILLNSLFFSQEHFCLECFQSIESSPPRAKRGLSRIKYRAVKKEREKHKQQLRGRRWRRKSDLISFRAWRSFPYL